MRRILAFAPLALAVAVPVSLVTAGTASATAKEKPMQGEVLIRGGQPDRAATAADAPRPIARATIRACGTNQPLGIASLRERRSDEGVKVVDVIVHVTDRNSLLSKGPHGVHIHEVGDCSAACAAAGGHFDPGPSSNPSPDGNHPFHMGDLVNIDIDANGRGIMRTTTSRVTVSRGPLSVLDANGSAFIIHAGADTYCPDGPVANCAGGARVACGIIRRAQ
jgi:superoxide dismutase, Cu-Zn family